MKFSRVAALFLVMGLTVSSYAQTSGDPGVKKSTKTETVDGKKFYLHTVAKGQTLYAIAKAYDLTVNDILVENPDALNGIKPGQVLKVPFQKPVPVVKPPVVDTGCVIHKVVAGETLYSIAKKNNTTEEAILKLNPEARNGLKVGQELKLPKGVLTQVVVINTPPTAADTTYRLNKKESYNVALMLPFQLYGAAALDPDCIVDKKCEFPAKSEAAIRFYQGALLALDSMKHAGMKVTLHVYDIDDADSAKVGTVLEKPEFKTMDLIIGPLSPGPFYPVSQWGKANHVAVVSPVSPANRVLFKQPEALKALPGISTQMDQLAGYVSITNRNDNIILLNSGNLKDMAAGTSFKNSANRILYPEGKDSIQTCKGISTLNPYLKKEKMNVIIVPSNNQAYVTDLLRMLYGLAEDYPITLYGTSTWMTFDNIDFEYLEKLQFHFVAPYYVDYDSTAATKKFIENYDYYYHGFPNAYSFAGYDVTHYFLNALYQYGTDFYAKIPDIKGCGMQQDFSYYRSDAESGYENKSVRIIRVYQYKLQRLK